MGDKKDVSNRFIEAYERLLKDGIVANKKEFASSVGVSALRNLKGTGGQMLRMPGFLALLMQAKVDECNIWR